MKKTDIILCYFGMLKERLSMDNKDGKHDRMIKNIDINFLPKIIQLKTSCDTETKRTICSILACNYFLATKEFNEIFMYMPIKISSDDLFIEN